MASLVAVLSLMVFGTAVISGIFGMAGGMLLMSGLSLMMPIAAAMVIHGFAQLGANGMRAWILRREIDWAGARSYLLGSLAALVLLAASPYRPSLAVVLIVLGSLPFAAQALKGWVRLDFSRGADAITAGFLVGAVQLLAGVAGPILDLFFVHTRIPKERVVATKAVTQALSHGMKLAFYWRIAAQDPGGLPGVEVFVFLLGATYLGTLIGTKILSSMDDRAFRVLGQWIILAMGATFLVRGFTLG